MPFDVGIFDINVGLKKHETKNATNNNFSPDWVPEFVCTATYCDEQELHDAYIIFRNNGVFSESNFDSEMPDRVAHSWQLIDTGTYFDPQSKQHRRADLH
jgi:hypothetical protein